MNDIDLNEQSKEHKNRKNIKKTVNKKTESKVTKLHHECQTLKSELDALNDKYLRLLAEFENYKKRREREISEFREYANISLVEELLSVLDDMERSLNSHEKLSAESLHQGVELIYKKFLSILERKGLEQIKAKGEKFDPELHDALMQIQDETRESNTIVEEVTKGYKFNKKIVRHSKVIVCK
ncbi:nucleotide exchange factor GrpE [candidate division KSB1 bacterium]|nr:nucleotide exchange factor GrpE [candidate division KSB1 bacterium]